MELNHCGRSHDGTADAHDADAVVGRPRAGSAAWAEKLRDCGMFDDDGDDDILMSAYDWFLSDMSEPDELRPMEYLSVSLPDGGHAVLPETGFTCTEARMAAIRILACDPESPLHRLDDADLSHTVFDRAARDAAVGGAIRDGMLSMESYKDETMEYRRRMELVADDEERSARWR